MPPTPHPLATHSPQRAPVCLTTSQPSMPVVVSPVGTLPVPLPRQPLETRVAPPRSLVLQVCDVYVGCGVFWQYLLFGSARISSHIRVFTQSLPFVSPPPPSPPDPGAIAAGTAGEGCTTATKVMCLRFWILFDTSPHSLPPSLHSPCFLPVVIWNANTLICMLATASILFSIGM